METLPEDFYEIECPCRLAIVGPTGSGKSSLIHSLVKYRESLFTQKFSEIVYVYPANSDSVMRTNYLEKLREVCPFIDFRHTISVTKSNLDEEKNTLIILDDLMLSMLSDEKMLELAIMRSHHEKISFIYTLQNPYQKGAISTTLARSVTGYFVFPNNSDSQCTSMMSSKILGKTKGSKFAECFEFLHHIDSPQKYIYVNCFPRARYFSFPYRVLGHLFPEDQEKEVSSSNPIRPLLF